MNESKTIARKRIAENLAGAGFARLWAKTPTLATVAERKAYQHLPEGRVETVVAVFPKALRVRGAPQWMRLSRDGIGHIKASGRGITPQELRLVQKAVDGDAVYRQSERKWAAFISDAEGKLWMVGWKVNDSGTAAWLVTLHRSNPKQLRQIKREAGSPLNR